MQHGGTAHFHAGVAPRWNSADRVADPRLTDAETGDEPDRAVRAQHLAMIPAEPAQRTRGAWSVVAPHVHTAHPESAPEAARRPPAPHPVVDHADAHAVARLCDQGAAELLAHGIVVDDVALEMDRPLGAGDRLEPGRIVLLGIFQHADAVARNERRAGGAGERLLGQGPNGCALRRGVRVHVPSSYEAGDRSAIRS